jgi:DNA-binding winged helix-turn-helix (wHTH) protein
MNVVTPLARIILAHEAEFALGGLRIHPSKRMVIAGDQREILQPRIMQVLVLLARRRGEVVSRDELIAACWGGNAVSDDAINRCIARIRRLAEAHGGFALETVPRVGYQLTDDIAGKEKPLTRRSKRLVAGLLGLIALLVAAIFIAQLLAQRVPQNLHTGRRNAAIISAAASNAGRPSSMASRGLAMASCRQAGGMFCASMA